MRRDSNDLARATRPNAGDRVIFQTEQMQGLGFLVAVVQPPDEPDAAMGFVAVLDFPQLLTLPIAAVRTVERGALVRRVLTASPDLEHGGR